MGELPGLPDPVLTFVTIMGRAAGTEPEQDWTRGSSLGVRDVSKMLMAGEDLAIQAISHHLDVNGCDQLSAVGISYPPWSGPRKICRSCPAPQKLPYRNPKEKRPCLAAEFRHREAILSNRSGI